MKYLPRYSAALFLWIFIAGTGCSSYEQLTIDDKIVLPDNSGFVFNDTISEKKFESKSARERTLLISSEKYLARGKGFTPESGIMDMGVDEALKGNYIEAEILFRQIKENITDGSIENNLAVIYELTKRKKEAMALYTNALVKSPDNPKFKSNFLSFINHNKFSKGK